MKIQSGFLSQLARVVFSLNYGSCRFTDMCRVVGKTDPNAPLGSGRRSRGMFCEPHNILERDLGRDRYLIYLKAATLVYLTIPYLT